ncbi:MAG TPA: hemerythrin domain-containing protein [Polyangiaceae bacterium]|jgi:hemerythrin-like domain-containing protein
METSRLAIDQLVREHSSMAVLLVMLDSYFAAIKDGDEVDDSLLLDAMRYLTEFADSVHHTKEDLAVAAVFDRTAAIRAAQSELDAQHLRIRQSGMRLRADLERALLDVPMPRGALAAEGFAYTAELRRSIEFEEQRLFPILVDTLDDDEWARVGARLGPRLDPLFGERAEAEYIQLLAELTERFVCAP